jgi:rhodanese-related sulfurtransferase
MPTLPTTSTTSMTAAPAIAAGPRRARRRPGLLRSALVLALLGVAITACSDSGSGSEGASASDGTSDASPAVEIGEQALEDGRTAIDVRTPEEYDAGHVDGAELIDIQGPDFDAQIAELDRDVEYVVYCRSGNRSAQAAARMTDAGLDVVDGGALTEMIEAGWPAA